MTDHEKAIVMAYTGVCMLAGDKLGIFYQYVREKLGHSVMAHELAYPEVQDAIKEAAKGDFIELSKSESAGIAVALNALDIQYSAIWGRRIGAKRDVQQAYYNGMKTMFEMLTSNGYETESELMVKRDGTHCLKSEENTEEK